MNRASIAGVVILCLFGLPFAGFGLFFAYVSGLAGINGKAEAWPGVLFGLVFACIGFGLMAAGIAGYRKQKRQAELQAANAETPWLWRPDWAQRRADGVNPKTNILVWVLAAVWIAISLPVDVALMPKLLADRDPRALLGVIFSLAGALILGFAIRGALRARRYGRTAFEFKEATFSPGSVVKGAIHLRLSSEVPHGFELMLSCKRRIVTGSGKNRSVQEVVLWQEQKHVAPESVLHDGAEAQVPVEFAIPGDAVETNPENPNDLVYWQLKAEADVPGIDFSDRYELPVFRTKDSEAKVSAVSEPISPPAVPEEAPIAAPAVTHVVYRTDWDGPSFYFPPLRNHAQAAGVVVFAAVWSAAVYLLWKDARAPWLFRIVFSIAEVLVGYLLLSVVFGSALLRVRQGVLEVRKSVLGIGRVRSFSFDEVASVAPTCQGQANTSGEALYGVTIARNTGSEINVAANSLTATEARWVVASIEAAMGRRQDTRVQFRSTFGAPPQGPVWGAAGSANASAVVVPQKTRQTQRLVAVAGLATWLLFAGSFFRNAFRDRGNGAFGGNNQRRHAQAATADFTHINSLPAQQQAENLLELSIRHDERALATFESKIESWTGQVQLTDGMKRLEERSRFSRDLRVRYANADLNLAIAGWHRDADAVDELMDQANASADARPASYYYLGMEGGRGVEAARVFAYLSDHALHDPNAVARQWAVEGLRFYKSDEALDILYRSFTSDASFAVRDRAGCNLSDCGIFTRSQRMRYVPKLIELSADPALAPQMRNWVFETLREITDETVPDDPAAWRRWYDQHGAEKARAFAALQWYEVRGDE